TCSFMDFSWVLDEVKLGDLFAEQDRAIDELGQELMQAALEDLLNLAVAQPRMGLARQSVAFAALAIGIADRIELARDLVVATEERARHLGPEDQQLGDQPGLEPLLIDPMIAPERRDRLQDRLPLVIVERAAHAFVLRQQHVIFDVEDARGVVAAFDESAKAREIER